MENKRGLYAVVGTVVLLFAGLVYAWSVIASPIAAFYPEWTKAQLSLTFTLCMSFFCFGCLFGGLLSKKVNVKMNMAISGVLFFIGFFIASRAESLSMLYIGYGVFAGFASGFVYNGVMSCITKWYADKPGFISGILLMGFGFGSFIIGKVYQAMTPAGPGVDQWRNTFFIFGIVLVVVLVIGSLIIKAPSEDYQAPAAAPKKEDPKAAPAEGKDFTPGEMLKRPSFWLYIIWTIALSAGGLALISQASGIVLEISPTTAAGTVATVVGLISILNGVGRVICGFLFDKIGRRKTMFIVDFVFFIAIGLVILALKSASFPMIIIAFIVSGLAYGGVTPMNSAFTREFYGAKNYPVNFSIINMNLLVASFGSTIAGMLYDATGSFMSAMMLMLAFVVVATISSVIIKRP